jgi:hypothetical protein
MGGRLNDASGVRTMGNASGKFHLQPAKSCAMPETIPTPAPKPEPEECQS